jgi:phosphoglycerate dehydrogenase-like enzyme
MTITDLTAAAAIYVGPSDDVEIAQAVDAAGAAVVPTIDEADAIVWHDPNPDKLPRALPNRVRWVQLPSAGVETWMESGRLTDTMTWTSAAGVFANTIAEHALMLLLAGVRSLPVCIRQQSWQRDDLKQSMDTIRAKRVAIVGCGGIGRALIPMLTAMGAETLAVTRRGLPVPGAAETLPADRVDEVWDRADHVVLAAPATPTTRHLVGAAELERLKPTSWLVNIARGALIDTDALVAALAAGSIAGAALDVTDPEPLPDGHPLWTAPRAIITPHVANPSQLLRAGYLSRIRENVRHFVAGEPLVAPVDLVNGY